MKAQTVIVVGLLVILGLYLLRPDDEAEGTVDGVGGLPPLPGVVPDAGALGAPLAAAPAVRGAVKVECFAESRRREYSVYPDLAMGGAYQPRRSVGEEAQASGMDARQLATVATVDDRGKLWTWTWGPSWGRMSDDHTRKVWARLRPGNKSYGVQDWDGAPRVVQEIDAPETVALERVAVHFIRGSSGMLDFYRSAPAQRLDLPARESAQDNNYQRKSFLEQAGVERTPSLDLWRIGLRVRQRRGKVSMAGYDCGGTIWVPTSQTVNWSQIHDRRADVEYLVSEFGRLAIRRGANGSISVYPPNLCKPVYEGDRVNFMQRATGVRSLSRRDAPLAWWGDSRVGMTMRAWDSLPWVGVGGIVQETR